jgi:hypothetical protein
MPQSNSLNRRGTACCARHRCLATIHPTRSRPRGIAMPGGSTFRLTPIVHRATARFCGCRILCDFLFCKGCGFRRRAPKSSRPPPAQSSSWRCLPAQMPQSNSLNRRGTACCARHRCLATIHPTRSRPRGTLSPRRTASTYSVALWVAALAATLEMPLTNFPFGGFFAEPSVPHPVRSQIMFEALVGNFHISEISTSKNVCRVVDSFPARSYNRFAKAFESSESS